MDTCRKNDYYDKKVFSLGDVVGDYLNVVFDTGSLFSDMRFNHNFRDPKSQILYVKKLASDIDKYKIYIPTGVVREFSDDKFNDFCFNSNNNGVGIPGTNKKLIKKIKEKRYIYDVYKEEGSKSFFTKLNIFFPYKKLTKVDLEVFNCGYFLALNRGGAAIITGDNAILEAYKKVVGRGFLNSKRFNIYRRFGKDGGYYEEMG